MASLRCHGDSDCNKTQIIKNFHLYIMWKPFFHIFTHGDVINAQTWEVSPPQKKSSRATLNYLKMHIIIIITGLQVTSRRPCWCGEEQKHFSPLGTLFSCRSLEITFIVLTTSMAANCDVVAN